MPDIVATDKFKARGYETIAVAMQYDPPSYVVNFAETRKLPFRWRSTTRGGQAWGDIKLTPTTYVVNKQGEIVSARRARLQRAAPADRKLLAA